MMSATPPNPAIRVSPHERGMVLITSLLLLVVVTILAIALFRSFGIDEKIAGNMREKQRALQAAMTAEEYAESWITSPNVTAAITCAAGPTVSYTVGQVCTTASGLTNPSALPWPTGVTYTPATMPTGANGFANPPIYYVTSLGPPASGTGTVYQIDAAGYGGSANTAAVIESTFLVQSGVTCVAGCNP
jgi:type IV pilus assembly protein PilX